MHSPDPLPRLYIVTRADLPDGLQAAQAVHAAFQYSVAHPDAVAAWVAESNFLVVVAVPDVLGLVDLIDEATDRDLLWQAVHEPDLDNALTAVVLEPGDAARRLCSSLPLALRERSAM